MKIYAEVVPLVYTKIFIKIKEREGEKNCNEDEKNPKMIPVIIG